MKCRFGGGKAMKKQLAIIGIAVLLLAVGLSGCEEYFKREYIVVEINGKDIICTKI